MNLDLQREQVQPLFIRLFTDFPRDVLVELVLDELLYGIVNVEVNLLFDSRDEYGSVFEAVS